MELIDQLEELHEELKEKVSDVFHEHLARIAEYERDFMQNIPEPWVFLDFKDGRLMANVNWSDSSADIGKQHRVEIQGLEEDAMEDEINLPDAISKVHGKRAECAAYLRKLADAIEGGIDA